MISVKTVDVHGQRIKEKLGASPVPTLVRGVLEVSSASDGRPA
jgi:DNA-binding CsgD family transcriptional regulator